MTPARFALTEAFGFFLGSNENEIYERPDQDVLLRMASKGLLPVKPERKHTVRKSISYVENGVTVTNSSIAALPERLDVSFRESVVRRTSTNHRCAAAIQVGKLLAEALNQPKLKAGWLEFAYDPYFDTDSEAKRRRLAHLILPGVFALWCFLPKKKRAPSARQLERLVKLFEICIEDRALFLCSGDRSRQRSPTEKAELLGYGVEGQDGTIKHAYKQSNWSTQWAPVEADIFRAINRLDRSAMSPVVAEYVRRKRISEVK